jgi:Domain of unknown function (DUF4055)
MTEAVAKRSAASAHMLDAAQKGRALMGGTTAMRERGEVFLPRFPMESAESYKARLNSSWLFNGYRKTVKDMTGRVFSKPVEIEGADSKIEDWCENVDMQGRDLSTFARQVFEDGLAGPGISYIMVDAPRREGVVTQAQAAAANLRPFMVSLKVEDILGWRAETVNNITSLTQLRIMETVSEPDPADEFNTKAVDQIRVLDLLPVGVQTRLYRKDDKTKKWGQTEAFINPALTEITVVPFYANRTGFFTGEPMLDDLADINIAHWQSQSDQRNILHVARVPILFGAGMADTEALTIGANKSVMASDPSATLQWVEHSGKAIEAGRQDLKDLEFQMETFGLQLLVPRQGAQSATGEALDANKETSQLSMTADALQDALEQALRWMGVYGGMEADPDVMVNKEFGVTFMNAQEATALLSAFKDGVLSRETVVTEMARRGLIRSDIDPEEEADRIDDEDIQDDGEDALAAVTGGMPFNSGMLNNGNRTA